MATWHPPTHTLSIEMCFVNSVYKRALLAKWMYSIRDDTKHPIPASAWRWQAKRSINFGVCTWSASCGKLRMTNTKQFIFVGHFSEARLWWFLGLLLYLNGWALNSLTTKPSLIPISAHMLFGCFRKSRTLVDRADFQQRKGTYKAFFCHGIHVIFKVKACFPSNGL